MNYSPRWMCPSCENLYLLQHTANTCCKAFRSIEYVPRYAAEEPPITSSRTSEATEKLPNPKSRKTYSTR